MNVERILIADADDSALDKLGSQLAAHGYEVFLASSGDELVDVVSARGCDVALIDLALPGRGGLEAARTLIAVVPGASVTLMGERSEIGDLSEELIACHYSYLQKPVTPGQVLLAVEQAAELKGLREENRMLRKQWEEDERPEDLVYRSPLMIDVLRQAATAADADEPVALYGAPGTEKEILALYAHRCSRRADKPLIRFECGRATGTNEEAELFGREYDGSNGAIWRRAGRLELAAGGTLFMDNISELSPGCQAKLLRFIDEGKFLRADADGFGLSVRRQGRRPTANDADVRIICASSQALDGMHGTRGLREDLLFRLNALSIRIPPLAERREDILPLAQRFLRRFALEAAKDVHEISPGAARLLEHYDWPGNVAELKDTIRTAVIGARRQVLLPEDLLRGPSRTVVSGVIGGVTGPSLDDAERQLILRTLHETHGNRTKAAQRLCITASTLCNKLARYRDSGLLGVGPHVAEQGVKKCWT